MEPRFNLWVEIGGEVVLSKWRLELLEQIERTGSISSAAEAMEVPYRRAWEKIHEMESRLGESLVETEVGGPGGGGARLTPLAQDLMRRFRAFAAQLDGEIQDRFQAAFES